MLSHKTPNPSPHLLYSRNLIQQSIDEALRPIVTTKFGPHSAVLLHLVTQVKPEIPVVWVDTGYNTQATLQHVEQLREHLSLNLSIWRPQPTDAPLQAPPSLDDPCHPAFTHRVKLEPFQRALNTLNPDLWFSSLRKTQTAFRASLSDAQITSHEYKKVLPLLAWSDEEVSDYRVQHQLPQEVHFYDPTKGEAKRECGLHLNF